MGQFGPMGGDPRSMTLAARFARLYHPDLPATTKGSGVFEFLNNLPEAQPQSSRYPNFSRVFLIAAGLGVVTWGN